MKTRIAAIVCLLCVVGYSGLSRAEDPSSQRGADPYAISSDAPTMSSGTPEFYVSILAGYALPRREDATFTDGSGASHGVSDVVTNVNYDQKYSIGGNMGVWFPTRNKLAGFDLGLELSGFLWHPDVSCCLDNFNRDPKTGQGTTTMMQGLYIGPNFLVRYPIAISETYPNGRWFPYAGISVGMHQMSMRPGGFHGASLYCGVCPGGGGLNSNPITDQRDTTVGVMGIAGIKAYLFKYVAAFAEAKYIHAHHDGLLTDRFGQSPLFSATPALVMNQYSSDINTIMVHGGLSIHFDVRP